MSKMRLIHGNAADYSFSADIIVTYPPFDMPAKELHSILQRYDSKHLVLIATMRQIIELHPLLNWEFSFDFVLDSVAPKKSRSLKQPNYTHHTGVYMYAPGEKSRFNRKLRQCSDVFDGNGYWPTIFHAPRERAQDHGLAKNVGAITDLIGSFDISSIIDMFAGSGTTALAAFELGLDCTAIELNDNHFRSLSDNFRFLEAI